MMPGGEENKRYPQPLRSLIDRLMQVPIGIECPFCHHVFANEGCLTQHIRSPAKGYRAAHNLANGRRANARKGRTHLSLHPKNEDEEPEEPGRIGSASSRCGR